MTRLGIFTLWLLHFLPLPLLAKVGNALGWLLFHLAKERYHVADTNLRLCFPELSDAARRKLVKQNCQAFARSVLERGILCWSSGAYIASLIRVEGEAHFDAVKNKSAILLMPHFVAMDAGGAWIAQHTDTVCMYANQKNQQMTELLLNMRTRFGNQRLYSRQQGLRPILKGLRAGMPFIYPPDQDQGVKDGAFIPFFGVLAATMTSVPRIAQMAHAQVVPCTTRLLPNGEGYVLTFYPAWENYPTGDDLADTRRMNEFIEERVREMPEQYFWLHKRFKNRPVGEASLY